MTLDTLLTIGATLFGTLLTAWMLRPRVVLIVKREKTRGKQIDILRIKMYSNTAIKISSIRCNKSDVLFNNVNPVINSSGTVIDYQPTSAGSSSIDVDLIVTSIEPTETVLFCNADAVLRISAIASSSNPLYNLIPITTTTPQNA